MVQFLKCTHCASHERGNMNLIFNGNVSARVLWGKEKKKTWKKCHSPFDKTIAKSPASTATSNFKPAVEQWWRWRQILTQNPNIFGSAALIRILLQTNKQKKSFSSVAIKWSQTEAEWANVLRSRVLTVLCRDVFLIFMFRVQCGSLAQLMMQKLHGNWHIQPSVSSFNTKTMTSCSVSSKVEQAEEKHKLFFFSAGRVHVRYC